MKNLFLKAKPTQILTLSNNNFQTRFIHKKPQVNIGKKADNHSKKPTTDDLNRQQGKQIMLTDRGTNQQTLSTSGQQTRKESLKQ